MNEEVNRFLVLPDYAEIFDELFGCADWREALDLSTTDERGQSDLRRVSQRVEDRWRVCAVVPK
jgi:hypothetical protein